MKDEDGCNVNNMSSQELKEGDCDDQTKDDNSECLFNSSVASDQRSDISSSKNSEISECDSGVASSQDIQTSLSSDPSKLSHSYFNPRTGTSFIHINSINRPIVKNYNNYIEKEWEVLKRKIMKPASIAQKASTETLEEHKKDISFIDEPEISNNNPKHARLHSLTLRQNKADASNNENPTSQNSKAPIKDLLHTASGMLKSQSEDIVCKSIKNEPLCSLSSSFYEPSFKDDYIGSSFSKTFLNLSTTSVNTPTQESIKSTLSPPVFLKPLTSIKTSLSHSSTEIVSCTYSPVSSASLFNPSNHNLFKVQSYKEEFLYKDPNYKPRQILTTTPSSVPHNISSSVSLSLTSPSSTQADATLSSHYPFSCSTIQNKDSEVIAEELELETFTSSTGADDVYNRSNNNNNNIKDKSLTLRELSGYNSTSTSGTACTTPSSTTFAPIISHLDGEAAGKPNRYQEMLQRRKMRSKKQHTTTSDGVPDYVGSKPLDEIIDFIENNKGGSEKVHKRSKKKVATGGKEKAGQVVEASSDAAKESKVKACQPSKEPERKVLNGEEEEEEEVTIDFSGSDIASKEVDVSIKTSSDSPAHNDGGEQVLETASKPLMKQCEEVARQEKAAPCTKTHRQSTSINSLDHIDKFISVSSSFYKAAHNEDSSEQVSFQDATDAFKHYNTSDEAPKIASSFSVVTKRKKVKSKHHSSDSQDSSKGNPCTDHVLLNNRSKHTACKPPRECNSAKACKNVEAVSKAGLITTITTTTEGMPALNAYKVSSFTRPISSPQLHSSTFNQTSFKPRSNATLAKSTAASTTTTTTTATMNTIITSSTNNKFNNTATSNTITNTSTTMTTGMRNPNQSFASTSDSPYQLATTTTTTTTAAEHLQSFSTNNNSVSNSKPLSNSDTSRPPPATTATATSGHVGGFFLDTKHLAKTTSSQHCFMFGFDDTNSSSSPLPSSTTSHNTQTSNASTKHASDETFNADAPDKMAFVGNASDLTFVHTPIVNSTLLDAATTNNKPHAMHADSSTLTAHPVNIMSQSLDQNELNKKLLRGCCDGDWESSNNNNCSPSSVPPSKQPPHFSPQNPLSPPMGRSFATFMQPPRPPPPMHLSQFFLPFSMPMMVLPSNHQQSHHYNNMHAPHHSMHHSPPNHLQLTSPIDKHYNSPPHHLNNHTNYPSHNNHFFNANNHKMPYFNQYILPSHMHRLPPPPPPHVSKDSRLNRHSNSFHRHNHRDKMDAKSPTEQPPLHNNAQNHCITESSPSRACNTDSPQNCHEANHSSNIHSSPVVSPHHKPSSSPPLFKQSSSSPPISPSNHLKSDISTSKSQFNLTKAQIYLDSIFKEVLKSKDVKVYPSSGQ